MARGLGFVWILGCLAVQSTGFHQEIRVHAKAETMKEAIQQTQHVQEEPGQIIESEPVINYGAPPVPVAARPENVLNQRPDGSSRSFHELTVLVNDTAHGRSTLHAVAHDIREKGYDFNSSARASQVLDLMMVVFLLIAQGLA